MDKNNGLLAKDGVSFLIPFVLITSCFALWGFANDITGPMVKAFSKIFRMSVTEGALVQVAFYLGYFVMAFPAALFIQRYSFKAGVLTGLTLYTAGALMFIPAQAVGMYYPFLLAYFNPMGALAGMFVAMQYVQARMSPMDSAARAELSDTQFDMVKNHDLEVLIQPYIFIGAVVILLLVLIRLMKMPKAGDTRSKKSLRTALGELVKIKNYREGVIAQFFYVGVQVMCWTFIIQYGTRVFMDEGMDERGAEILSQKYNILAMVFFTFSRFICTWFLKYLQPGRLLSILAVCGAVAVCGAILFTDRNGVYCLVAVSACMSLMFPTIYGIALRGLGDNVKFGGAGLIMSILGGSVFPPLQAALIDSGISFCGLPSTNISFIIPLICFVVIATYGHRAYVRHNITHDYNS